MIPDQKKSLVFFLVFGAVAVISAWLPELGLEYFSGWDGLGRTAYLTVLVTIPSALLSIGFLAKWLWSLYRNRRP